jgi:protein SCO1/2
MLVSCSRKPAEPIKQYPMRGVVTQLDQETQVATINHEDIPGFMHAMTMEYGFRDKKEFAKLKKGATIRAKLFVQGDDFWVGEVSPGDSK